MSYFPESLMPANVKSEAENIDGNKLIISASDFNRVDEEIRSLEKVIGTPKLRVGDVPAETNTCSLWEALVAMARQLELIRDDMVWTTSGVVAVKDADVVGIDGKIPFSETFPVTTLISSMPDDLNEDEGALPPIPVLTLDDVFDMPDEGYISIVNDVGLAAAPVSHAELSNFSIFSPSIVNAKVGKDFVYDIVASSANVTVTTGPLPSGLTLQGTTIKGKPKAEAAGTGGSVGINGVEVRASNAGQQATVSLRIYVAAANTPTITNSSTVITVDEDRPFRFFVTYTGLPKSMAVSGLPAGVTSFGSQICGTPSAAGSYPLTVTLTDEFGDTAEEDFTLVVS